MDFRRCECWGFLNLNNLFFDFFNKRSCYWAGFIAADGNLFKNQKKGIYKVSIHLNKKDIYHLEKFKNDLQLNNKIYVDDKSAHLQIYNKYLFYSLINNFNLCEKKSFVLGPPVKMPNEFVFDYIRGYFDGDGHIGYNGSTYLNFNLVSASFKIIEWMFNILRENKLIEGQKIYRKKNCFVIDVNNYKAINIFKKIYETSSDETRLERKFNCFVDFNNKIEEKVKYKRHFIDYEKVGIEYLEGKTLLELSNQYNVSKWTLLDNFKKLNIKKRNVIDFDKKCFSCFSSENCYWAGFIAADGWVSKYKLGIELSSKDEKHLNKFKEFLQSSAEIKRRFKNNKQYSAIYVNSISVIDDLRNNFNITQNKSLSFSPSKLIPKEFEKDFIRGYFDGDGTVGLKNNFTRLTFCSGSEQNIEWIRNRINTNNKIYKRNSNLFILEICGNPANNALNWMYANSNNYLDRKYEKFLELKNVLS